MRVCSLCHRCFDDGDLSCIEAGHPSLSEPRSGSPDMIKGYRLDFLLTSGIRGDLYRAHQTACGRSCLITIVQTDNARQFLDEAKLAASLFHPNLADVYEAGALETGECFVVAEDPEDQTLRDRLQTAGVPKLLKMIEIIRQTAEALHAIHLKGFTHRAVRPENIILSADVESQTLVRLQNIDFAGVVEHSIVSNKFLIDSAIDSLRYFAPEQCSGEPVGIQTDIYSLGIILYEMLAGAPPFDATTAAGIIDKHRNHRPPDIRIDDFELRMLITHTLMESLHKRPDRRQSSANAFARQLRHIEQLATHVSTPPPAGTVKIPPRTTEHINAAVPRVVQPTSAMEPPRIIMEQGTRTKAPAKVIAEQVTRSEAPAKVVEQQVTHIAPPAIEPVRSVTAAPEIESLSAAVAAESASSQIAENETTVAAPPPIQERPSDELSKGYGTAIANFVRERRAPAVSHFSRLKLHRKKLHSKTAPAVEPAPEIEPPSNAEADETAARAGIKSARDAALHLQAELAAVEAARAKKKTKKIECRVSEDDIPMTKDFQSLTEEAAGAPVVQAPPKAIEVPAPVQTQPARIAWTQPEDNIPSLADVQEFLFHPITEALIDQNAQETAAKQPETPKILVTVEPHPEPATTDTAPIRADAPAIPNIRKFTEQNAPSFKAPVNQKAAARVITESPVPEQAVEAAKRPVVIVPRPEPKPERTRPVVEEPKKPAVKAVNAYSGPIFNIKPRGIRLSGLQSSNPKAPAAVEEFEEITLVSPARSRFRVPVNKPQPARRHTPARRVVPIPANDVDFFPTLLGGTVKPAPIEIYPTASILSAYAVPQTRTLPYRSLIAGTGFILLIGFFLFAKDSIWEYASIATSGDSVSAKSSPSATERRPAAASEVTTPAAKKKPAKAIIDNEDESVSAPPPPATRTAPERSTTPAKVAEKTPAEPIRRPDPEPVRPMPRPDPVRRAVETKPEPITVRSSGATRPRIVQEQR